MKKHLLALTVATVCASGCVLAADEEIDMSSPTEAYTALGVGYGNEGTNLKAMYMISEKGADRKTGFLLEANDIFDEEGGDPQFSGLAHRGCKHMRGSTCWDKETSNRNYRFRYGSLNTKNGLGHMVDAVIKDHPFFGQMGVAQAGVLATIPIGDNAFIWPVLLAGAVVMEDNYQETTGAALASQNPALAKVSNTSSSGIDIASLVYSTKIYGRYKFNDTWWLLGAWTYTDEFSGKSWNKSIAEGGLQLSPQQFELSLGYQITKMQNIRLNWHSYSETGHTDNFWVEYNYAF